MNSCASLHCECRIIPAIVFERAQSKVRQLHAAPDSAIRAGVFGVIGPSNNKIGGTGLRDADGGPITPSTLADGFIKAKHPDCRDATALPIGVRMTQAKDIRAISAGGAIVNQGVRASFAVHELCAKTERSIETTRHATENGMRRS